MGPAFAADAVFSPVQTALCTNKKLLVDINYNDDCQAMLRMHYDVDSCRSCMASSLFRIVLTLKVEIDDRMLYYTVSFLFRYTDQNMGLRICLHVSSLYTAQQQRPIELILGQ
jgi:hypothetical protein